MFIMNAPTTAGRHPRLGAARAGRSPFRMMSFRASASDSWNLPSRGSSALFFNTSRGVRTHLFAAAPV